MYMTRGLLMGLLVVFSATSGWTANHVSVESKNVALGATGVTAGVYVENDVPIVALVLPLELRSASPGTYVTTAFAFGPTAGGRVNNSPLGPAGPTWPPANITARKYAVTATPACSGPVSNTYNTAAAQIDFVSPDGVMHATVSTGDPNAGEDITLPPGSDPQGTPSFLFTFNVNNVDGFIEIDTCCVRPANHLSYVDEQTEIVTPTFTKSTIRVGNPQFPPIITPIPDQTIPEGGSFTPITLDNFVSDADNPDNTLTWTAAGQSQLIVSISPSRVATITTPNPDWFGSETIRFTVTDPTNNTDVDTVVFTVTPVNDPPILANITPKSRLAGLNLSFTISGSDVDNTCPQLNFSMANAPAGAALTNDGNCGAAFEWPTVCTDSGVYNVTFIVSDGALADSQVVTITIQPNPDRFDTNPDSLLFTFAAGQSDPDSQMLIVNDPGCGEMDFEVLVSEPWLLVTPDTATTTAQLKVDIDTAGLAAGDYVATMTLRQINAPGAPATLDVRVYLSVTTEICECPCHGEPIGTCDGIHNIADLVKIIGIVFRGQLSIGFATCPTEPVDVNCDLKGDVLDVVRYVDYIWRSGSPLCDPCLDIAR